ncbi:MAG: hypothetical protein KBD21_03020 [Candidatus Pacebacteria bacterium]|nr:hypothetical protein [Candidatus Paceibacterota bacterium]
MKKHLLYGTLASLALPFFVSAQAATEPDFGWLEAALEAIGGLIAAAIPVLIALGLLLFIWGLVVFIFSQGDDDAQARGKRLMVWGVIALFVIVSVWGLVALLNQLVGVDQGTGFETPDTGL